MLKLATAIEKSGDSKLANCPIHSNDCRKPCKDGNKVSATYVAQASCPPTCPFKGKGCYAEAGHTGIITNRLNKAVDGDTPIDIAIAEAAAIDGLSGKNPLRLHVVGDCSTNVAAFIVSTAAGRYASKFGSKVWTYTHAWRQVARFMWQKVSVLASCETEQDAIDATDKGYAVAVVAEHENLPKMFGGLRTIKCPQQTGTKLDCASCQMCMNADKLVGKACIVFDPHGVSVKRVKLALQERNNDA